jgi:hypothetical protein
LSAEVEVESLPLLWAVELTLQEFRMRLPVGLNS